MLILNNNNEAYQCENVPALKVLHEYVIKLCLHPGQVTCVPIDFAQNLVPQSQKIIDLALQYGQPS